MPETPPARTALIAVIADTHGLIDRRVLEACAGADLIVHAGDVGARSVPGGARAVLDQLERVAPVIAVRGNRDRHEEFGASLPTEAEGEVSGLRFVVAHTRRELKAAHPDPAAEGIGLLVYGHTHQPELRFRGHEHGRLPVIWLNPGTCTAPLPWDPRPSMAYVTVQDGEPEARIVFFP
jgi:putative phosphoesterase